MCKEDSVKIKIINVSSNEKILQQHAILNYQIDLYFSEHELAIEVDKKGHWQKWKEKKKKKENEREEKIKKELGCKFIRINLDAEKIMLFLLRMVK